MERDLLGATGRLVRFVPEGPDRDQLLELVRLGAKFRAQQRGRRPGFLHRHVASIVGRLGARITFEQLLNALALEAARGEDAARPPIEQVSRSFELVTYHDPRHGRRPGDSGSPRTAVR